MALSIHPIDPIHLPNFIGEVAGFDMRRPATTDEIHMLSAGMDRFAALVFREQNVTDEQQLDFTRRFGPLEEATGDISLQSKQRRLRSDVNDISNLDENNQRMAVDDRRRLLLFTNRNWHSDSSYKPTPAKYSLLSARIVPSVDANTEFADMRAAYDELDTTLKSMVEDLVALHSQFYQRSQLGYTLDDFSESEKRYFTPVPQRLVRRHPVTGRKSLFLSGHAGGIVGWSMPEARVLLRDLTEHATRRKFVYSHRWLKYDLVMWDNRVIMHRATRYDGSEVRELHRTTVADSAPTLEQPA